MSASVKTKFSVEKFNKISEWLFLAFIAECAVGSSGRWLEVGPLSIRMILFALAFVFSLPAVISKFFELAKNLQVIFTVLFGIYIAFSAFVGFTSGNQLGFVAADVTTLMTLALIPGFMAVMCNKQAIERSMKVIFWASAVLAVITVLLHIIIAILNNNDFVYNLNKLINADSLGGLAALKTGMHRIYFKSQIFFQVAIVYGVWFLGQGSRKQKIITAVFEGIIFCAFILSYTRGFWFGLGIAAIALLICGFKYWKHYFKTVGAILSVFAVFVLISAISYRGALVPIEIVNRFDPTLIVVDSVWGQEGLDNFFDEDSDLVDENNIEAANRRAETLAALEKKIAAHPIFGNGLGENLDGVRNDGKTEYMYLDMLMKTGIVGTLLFIGTYFWCVVKQIRCAHLRRKKQLGKPEWNSAYVRNLFVLMGYISVAATSLFNPFLNNPMGIMLLMVTSAAMYEKEAE